MGGYMAAAQIGTSILGGVLGSSAKKKAAKRAKKIAKADAKAVRKLGPEEAKQILRQGRRLEGRQRLNFGGSGVDVNSGTPLDVMAETIAETEMSAIRAIQSRNDQAASIERQGSAASALARAGAAGSILSGVSGAIGAGASYLQSQDT